MSYFLKSFPILAAFRTSASIHSTPSEATGVEMPSRKDSGFMIVCSTDQAELCLFVNHLPDFCPEILGYIQAQLEDMQASNNTWHLCIGLLVHVYVPNQFRLRMDASCMKLSFHDKQGPIYIFLQTYQTTRF